MSQFWQEKLTYFLLPFFSSLKLYVAGDLVIPNCLPKDTYSVHISCFSKQMPVSSLRKWFITSHSKSMIACFGWEYSGPFSKDRVDIFLVMGVAVSGPLLGNR